MQLFSQKMLPKGESTPQNWVSLFCHKISTVLCLFSSQGSFYVLLSPNRSWRCEMPCLCLLAFRWSLSAPFWCTLAPSRSLSVAANPATDDQRACHASLLSPRATCHPQHLVPPHTPAGHRGMFHRFTSALFGGDVEELSHNSQHEDGKEEEEEDEDWILVNYLGKAYEIRPLV